ncbi:MAG: YciI family protein [Pseudomonadota bacterium]
MMYAVLFEDDAERAAMRPQYMPDHLAFLEAHAAAISAAGPLQDAASNEPAGGLWIVEAESTQAVQALVETDPFWPTGLRKSVRILAWTQVFADGERRV